MTDIFQKNLFTEKRIQELSEIVQSKSKDIPYGRYDPNSRTFFENQTDHTKNNIFPTFFPEHFKNIINNYYFTATDVQVWLYEIASCFHENHQQSKYLGNFSYDKVSIRDDFSVVLNSMENETCQEIFQRIFLSSKADSRVKFMHPDIFTSFSNENLQKSKNDFSETMIKSTEYDLYSFGMFIVYLTKNYSFSRYIPMIKNGPSDRYTNNFDKFKINPNIENIIKSCLQTKVSDKNSKFEFIMNELKKYKWSDDVDMNEFFKRIEKKYEAYNFQFQNYFTFYKNLKKRKKNLGNIKNLEKFYNMLNYFFGQDEKSLSVYDIIKIFDINFDIPIKYKNHFQILLKQFKTKEVSKAQIFQEFSKNKFNFEKTICALSHPMRNVFTIQYSNHVQKSMVQLNHLHENILNDPIKLTVRLANMQFIDISNFFSSFLKKLNPEFDYNITILVENQLQTYPKATFENVLKALQSLNFEIPNDLAFDQKKCLILNIKNRKIFVNDN
ncbi:hypothetical protein TRFO_10211 [Tritrichomonas foetus]|uniref:Protein kinase domain-containing protein n=1 Tax=Tritrichomonas foetus TaxID=1144522 RepID=A0A1J4JCP8_9EUKA|nr:hypothetical protein TRFO_10211 [Tritrichomonas foetus]|eukprot:OHS96031.1 hypothetical protein TRFO_10211 [Tritrichomonas foetus]